MRIARPGVARPAVAARSRPLDNGTVGVQKVASIIAIINARIAPA